MWLEMGRVIHYIRTEHREDGWLNYFCNGCGVKMIAKNNDGVKEYCDECVQICGSCGESMTFDFEKCEHCGVVYG